MDFTAVDKYVYHEFYEAEKKVLYRIDQLSRIAGHRFDGEYVALSNHLRCRTLQEIFHDINIRVLVCIADYRELFAHIPNTINVDIQPGDHYSADLEVSSGLPRRFKRNLMLEKEYESDVTHLINYLRPVGMIVNIKFFHYYL